MAGAQTKKKGAKKQKGDGPVPQGASADALHHKKVDEAFALMDKLEGNPSAEGKEIRTDKPDAAAHGRNGMRSGLRIRFGVDALVSEGDRRSAPESDVRPGESTLFDFGITLPYIWQVPLVGKTALKLIRHFQREDRPKTVRDILQSLREKSI